MSSTPFGSLPAVRWAAAASASLAVIIHVGIGTGEIHEALFKSNLSSAVKIASSVCFNLASAVVVGSAVVLVRTAGGNRSPNWELATAGINLFATAMFVVAGTMVSGPAKVVEIYPMWILGITGALAWCIARSP